MYKKLAMPLLCLGFMLAAPIFPSVQASPEPSMQAPPNGAISNAEVKYVLDQCQLIWVGYNFTNGELRSAYNRGELILVKTVKPDGDYFDVYFGGLVTCVIISA